MRVGILGGMFDPIHYGHTWLAQRAMEDLKLDKVIFVPVGIPGHRKAPLLSNEIRLEMIKNVCKIWSFKKMFSVDDWSLRRKIPTYTIDYLKHIKKECPDDDFFLILGEDELFSFSNWKDPQKIMGLVTVVGYPRKYKYSSTIIKDKWILGRDVRWDIPLPAYGIWKEKMRIRKIKIDKPTHCKETLKRFHKLSKILD